MNERIEPMLAVAIAGQVAAGATPGDGQDERMHSALLAIGVMLLNATDSDLVRQVLDGASKARIERLPDAHGWRIVPRGDE